MEGGGIWTEEGYWGRGILKKGGYGRRGILKEEGDIEGGGRYWRRREILKEEEYKGRRDMDWGGIWREGDIEGGGT